MDIDIQIRNYETDHGAPEDNPDLVTLKVQHGVGIDKLKKIAKMWGARPVGDPVQGSAYLMVSVQRSDLKATGKFTQKVEITEATHAKPHAGVAEYLPVVDMFPAGDPNLEDLDKAEEEKDIGLSGKRVFFDSEWVTGQTATYKRLRSGSDKYMQVVFRINRRKMDKLPVGGSSMNYPIYAGSFSDKHDALDVTGGGDINSVSNYMKGRGVQIGQDRLVLVRGKGYASQGLCFADIYGSDIRGSLKKLLTELIDEETANAIVSDTTAEDRTHVAARRLMSAYQPAAHDSLVGDTGYAKAKTAADWMKAIEDHGLKEKLAHVREVDGVEGHLTHVLPGRWKEATHGGEVIVKFCVHGTGSGDSVPHVLKTGLAGAVMRGMLGTTKTGACNATDWSSGGADTAGIRIVTKAFLGSGLGSLGGVGAGAAINFIIAPDVLDRLDVVLHGSDSYQCTGPVGGYESTWTGRKPLKEKIKSLNSGGGGNGHEAIVLRGVTPKKIIRVVCSGVSTRQTVLAACAMEGVTEHNGIPITDFIVTENQLDTSEIYTKYVKPAGY